MSTTVIAQIPRQDPAEELLQQRRQAEEQRRLQQPSLIPNPSAPGTPEQDSRCFHIEQIDLRGNSLLPVAQLDALLAPHRQTCMGRNAINQLMQELTNAYLNAGYVTTRVYIPQQDLQSGVLQLMVLQGFIETITVNDNSASDQRKLHWALPDLNGQILDLRQLEQGIDQLNRVPSANASMQLWPGSEAGGTRVAITTHDDDQLRGYLSVDNDGQESTGVLRTNFGVDWDNLFDINDNGSWFLLTAENTNAMGFSIGIPWRRWSFTFEASYSEYYNRLTEFSDLFGQSRSYQISGDWLWFRDQRQQWKWEFSLSQRDSRRFITGIGLTPQRLTPLSLGASWSWRGDSGLLLLRGNLVTGLNELGADDDHDQVVSDAPRAQFNKLTFSSNWTQALNDAWTWRSNARLQYSDDLLYGGEQFSFGGRNSLQGNDNGLSGDSGWQWRNEMLWRHGWQTNPDHRRIWRAFENLWAYGMPYAVLDMGGVSSSFDHHQQHAAGAGFGLRYGGAWGSAELGVGRGLVVPDEQPIETRYYASLRLSLF